MLRHACESCRVPAAPNMSQYSSTRPRQRRFYYRRVKEFSKFGSLKGIHTGPEPAPHPFCRKAGRLHPLCRNRFVAPVSSHLSTRQVATGNPFCRNAAPVLSHYYQVERSFYSTFQGLNL
jgi:hypothetical protein